LKPALAWVGRGVLLLVLSAVALQLVFVLRVAAMVVIDPHSSTFQRTEIWRQLREGRLAWHQAWRPYAAISDHLKRAVIAAEDASFPAHGGVDWEAIEKAWERNERAEARAAQRNERLTQQLSNARSAKAPAVARIVGGSTITQQLAKNLFLSSERSLARKGQEFVITGLLEGLLGKQRILEIYLNSVEWGDGVFGAEAAAQRYFRTDAGKLAPFQAARLAVMLPSPKRFEKRPASAYVVGRASTIAARMTAVELP
jgi:monofunctional biosynthetic peptidoglycan transglycosylase